MQGLHQLYQGTGRRAEWKRLVDEIVPNFIDPESEGPLPEREEDWGLVTDYRIRLAIEERQWAEAERLQTVCVDWDRQRTASALAQPTEDLESRERMIQSLAASLGLLGYIRREMGYESCVQAYEESLELSKRVASAQ